MNGYKPAMTSTLIPTPREGGNDTPKYLACPFSGSGSAQSGVKILGMERAALLWTAPIQILGMQISDPFRHHAAWPEQQGTVALYL